MAFVKFFRFKNSSKKELLKSLFIWMLLTNPLRVMAVDEEPPFNPNFCNYLMSLGKTHNFHTKVQERIQSRELVPHKEHVFHYGISMEEFEELVIKGQISPKPYLNGGQVAVTDTTTEGLGFLEKRFGSRSKWNSEIASELANDSFLVAKSMANQKSKISLLRSNFLAAGDFQEHIDQLVEDFYTLIDEEFEYFSELKNGVITFDPEIAIMMLTAWESTFPEVTDIDDEEHGVMYGRFLYFAKRMGIEDPNAFETDKGAQARLARIFSGLTSESGIVLSLKASALEKLVPGDSTFYSVNKTLTLDDIAVIYPVGKHDRKRIQEQFKFKIK